MKRIVTLLFTTLLLSAALCVGAAASDFDAVAEDLAEIGMFRGTAAGFELDRAPTRSEAAIMLVRLYGAEESAAADYAAGKISHPFTDVSDTAAPYVAYLYTNGITNGTSATTYGSAAKCTAQNYVVFLLRALGYEDGTDFAYADALTFAQSKGFYTEIMFPGEFLRDDLAAVTYQALATDCKDGSGYLLATLIESGAIDSEKAASLTETIETYRSLLAATADMDQTAMDADISVKMDIAMEMDGEESTLSSLTTGNVKVLMEDGDLEMAFTSSSEADGVKADVGMWMKDGWMYMSLDDAEEGFSYKYPVEDQLAALADLPTTQIDTMAASGLAMVDSITAAKSGTDTVYTMVIGQGMGGILDQFQGLLGDESGLDIGEITAVYTVGRDGSLKSLKMLYSASVSMDMGEELGSMDAAYNYDVLLTINATGKDVKITYPDFSAFQEVDLEAVPELTA